MLRAGKNIRFTGIFSHPLNGPVSISTHLNIDGAASSITSSAGFIGFGSSRLATTENLSADTLNGNVGVNTTVPAFPFEVHGNSAFTGTIFVDRLAA